jgi:predicted nucleic acid-binding Zn ribbon protein
VPVYEYKCKSGHVTEVSMPITGVMRERVKCGRCAKMADRVYGWKATIYKGAGFATNDFGIKHRRKNPGDDLPVPHDPVADAILGG